MGTISSWISHKSSLIADHLFLSSSRKVSLALDRLISSSSPDVKLVGDKHSGWIIQTKPLPEIVYCAGVGHDMTFELELAKVAIQPVVALDPTPTGISTVSQNDTRNIKFFPIGLAANTGVVEFSLPENPGEGSYSVPRDGLEKVTYECWSLSRLMDENGHSSIDLLKMDIEGFEFDVVDHLLDSHIPVRQLCIEFHPWLRPGRLLPLIVKLHKAGYRLICKYRGDLTFLMDQDRYEQLVDRCDLQDSLDAQIGTSNPEGWPTPGHYANKAQDQSLT